MRKILYIALGLLLAACTTDSDEAQQPTLGRLNLTTSVSDFDGGGLTRTNMAGTDFATGDRIKLKIICPYVTHTNFGETTYSNSADGLWLLEWEGTAWGQLEPSDSVDMMAHYQYDGYNGSNNLFNVHEAQQTPYVYTASTWNENVFFMAPNAKGSAPKPFSQYSYIFHADQTLEKDYLKSDLLWAQTYMQTGAYNVHLSFNHVMACLKIDISALGLAPDSTVVTLEGMPDIDQREVVVGDYYAEKAKALTHQYGSDFDYSYQQKTKCDYANNGQVLGVAIIVDSLRKAMIHPMTGNPTPRLTGEAANTPVANTGVYTAHYHSGHYYLIVPPCKLDTAPTLWIRRGTKRYSYTLPQDEETEKTIFEQGKLYPIDVTEE